jgi:hypothetical protein
VPEPTACPPDDRLAELALGQLAGRDRAEVLAHLAGCPACAAEVDALLAVSEHLLLGVEEAEPPAGFESAVLARVTPIDLGPARARSRRRSALLTGAVAAALTLVFVLGAMLAPSGTPVAEAEMATPTGRDVGTVWRYEDDPSWVFLSIPAWARWAEDGRSFQLRATLTDGSTADLGPVTFTGRDGTWATATELDVRSVSVVDTTGRVWCTGRF